MPLGQPDGPRQLPEAKCHTFTRAGGSRVESVVLFELPKTRFEIFCRPRFMDTLVEHCRVPPFREVKWPREDGLVDYGNACLGKVEFLSGADGGTENKLDFSCLETGINCLREGKVLPVKCVSGFYIPIPVEYYGNAHILLPGGRRLVSIR